MSHQPTDGVTGALGHLSSAARQVLLQNILRERGARVQETIPRRASRGPAPLSFAQQRLWLVHQMEPDSPAYNIPHVLRLHGELDPRALRRSLSELVRRHESLRTVIREHGGEPVQVIGPAAPVPLPLVDLRGVPDGEREARRLVAAEAQRPFDLARGPVLRSTLLRLDEREHVICFTVHHVVSDGWSMKVLVREVSELYQAFSRGGVPELPGLPLQYTDFAVWERGRLTGRVLDEQLAYWKDKLRGAPPLLEVPTDRPRAAGNGVRAGSREFALSAEAARALRALSRREGTTLFMTLLAGWQLLLARYAGIDDVVVGTPIAGRTRRETEGLIGFFVNMLALRGELAGDPTVAELLARVRETALGAYAHQELPFERLVDEMVTERSPTHDPVFQVNFLLQPASEEAALMLAEVEVASFSAIARVAKHDLELEMTDGEEALTGVLGYRTSLFDADTAERMLVHLAALLEEMAAGPERRLSELSMLRGAERARLLEAACAPAAAHLLPCAHELFAEQAARTPHDVAVAFGGESLTYAELECRAGRLALHLRSRGVGPETRVGICAERSPELVVGLLGTLMAGGAYVPIDPAYPAERIAYMLGDAAVPVLLTQERLLERLPAHAGETVCLDRDGARIAAESAGPPAARVDPDGLAYVIYTSGSSGRPKGVEVVHRGLSNYLAWAAEAYAGEGHGAPVHSSLAFDLTVTSLLVPLLQGGRVVLVPEEAGVDGLARALREQPGFTLVKLTPAHLALLAEQLSEAEAAAAARTLVVGGEALPPETAAYWRRVAPGTALVNEYGPTETVVGCCVYRVAEVPAAGGGVPIGRPIAAARLHVLGEGQQPLPAGVVGELYVGGAGVARGYLGRPELTAERFVPDGLGGEPGARLYRTGDRARWRADGELEYLGRTDEQVKVRGFRIEPGEIEAALREHGGVRDAVVVAREDAPGEKRLVAYLVPEPGAEAVLGAVQKRVRERLPEYMAPAAYVILDSLPLTANGKADRRALPAPEGSGGDAYVAPRSPTEEILAGIWAEVLRVERVGVRDDFFELGGHSLLGMQIVARVRQALGVRVPLLAVFKTPTVAALAGRLDALLRAGTLDGGAPPERASREGPLPLSFAQQRLWIVDRLEPESPAYNMPFALRLRGALDAAALRASIGELVRRHEVLRTVFEERDGEPVQVVCPPAPARLPLVDLGTLPNPEREMARQVAEEADRPFDLARGPLLRSVLLRLRAEEHVLLFTLHHIVSDGWSTDVLVREMSVLYAALSRGEAAHLPELPVQYADYALWQRRRLSDEVLAEQLGYWKARLAGAPPLLEVPTDHPRAPGQSARVGSHPLRLSQEAAGALRALSRREGATLFMTLLAGWQALLGRYAAQEDVVVGTPVAGRTHAELEGLVGFFVNMLALRGRLGGDPTWRELVARVRDEALGAYAHQDVPFERLVEELVTERSVMYAPLFQAAFSLGRDGGGDRLRLGRVELEPFAAGEGVAKFDLGLEMLEGEAGLSGTLTRRTSLFEAATAERMARHLETLLDSMAARPEARVSEVSLLRGAERVQVLEAWNATAAALPRACVH
ncbi:MAG TPA: amino acid adenylation domain-containing protein, partial [Longimicrobiaceae bacterium]|nr:amino acid adenylation domain-containing protein [Longimicrobiaceae bacterium]